MAYQYTLSGIVYTFKDIRELLAKASPKRSGDALAGLAAMSFSERVAAQFALADLPLRTFLNELVIPYETDEISRLIIDTHQPEAFAQIASLTVGSFRDWLLSEETTTDHLRGITAGLTPEMVAAVSKIMSIQDMVIVARKCNVVTKFRNTIGLPGKISSRLQPNHPFDDPKGIAASIVDGLLYGSGDAMIGINPATDNTAAVIRLLEMVDAIRLKFDIPTQSCVLSHITTTFEAIKKSAPVDLVFQSIAGTELANKSFGINLNLLSEVKQAALELGRNPSGKQIMYFETGQGSALSANAHHGVDQQTVEVRAYALARHFDPFLVNTVVGFIGPEYLYDGKQIQRAGVEDHFSGKLLGLPMGCDVCYTNHAEADQDDMDTLLTLLGASGCNFIMGVPGADDIMLNYQSTSFHDIWYLRKIFNLGPAPEYEKWLQKMNIINTDRQLQNSTELKQLSALLNL